MNTGRLLPLTCGREIAYKDMQVDHFQPLRAWGIEDAGTDDLDNLMPACRMCNHYKRANSLETFRRYIAEIPRKLRENYIYKVGIVYGEIQAIAQDEHEKAEAFCAAFAANFAALSTEQKKFIQEYTPVVTNMDQAKTVNAVVSVLAAI